MARGGAYVSGFLYALILVLAVAKEPAAWAQDTKKKETSWGAFSVIDKDRIFFVNNPEARKYRFRYEVLINRFQAFAKKWPTSPKASQALIYAAQLSEDIAQITRAPKDATAAVHAYLVVVSQYPSEDVADEALYKAARLKKESLKDTEGAVNLLQQFLPEEGNQSGKFRQSRLLLSAISHPKAKNHKEDKLSSQGSIVRQIVIQGSEESAQIKVLGLEKVKWSQGEIVKSANMPRRIFFDLFPAVLADKIPSLFEIKKGKIHKMRVGQLKPDVVRLVFEVDDGDVLISPRESEGLILDVSYSLDQNRPEPTFQTVAQKNPELIRKVTSRPKIIVLDPGHGGDDPGAIGHRGLQEKQVTLEIARRIKKTLEAEMSGVKVYLTRHNDQTVHLSKRTEIANNLEADLFVSIHANAAPNVFAQGIETYYLNISHDRYAIRLAARENAMSETEISNLEFILADLAMKSNVTDSIRLGQVVQASVFSKVREKWDDAKDLGLKHALFYVLMGVRMPAILIETSFISNKVEEKRLKSDAYQHALASGVVKGIKRYMEDQQAMYTP